MLAGSTQKDAKFSLEPSYKTVDQSLLVGRQSVSNSTSRFDSLEKTEPYKPKTEDRGPQLTTED